MEGNNGEGLASGVLINGILFFWLAAGSKTSALIYNGGGGGEF